MVSEPMLPIGVPPPVEVEPLSADAKRTQRRREHLDAGIHPATGLPLADSGETCGTCVHHLVRHRGSRWHKCELAGVTHGPGTDIRVSWPACQRWEPDDV